MSADNLRSFATRKFRLIEAAGSDPELSAPFFRLLLCVLDRLPEGSSVVILGDDYLRDECPGYRRDGSLRKARSAIRAIGYWDFVPGSGRDPTAYTVKWGRVTQLLAERKKRAKIRSDKRDERDAAFRALGAVRRGELVPTPGKIDPPSSSAQRRIISVPPQNVQEGGSINDPPFYGSASMKTATEREVASLTRARARVLGIYDFDLEEIDLAARSIGDGDAARGFALIALLDDAQIRTLGIRLDDAGADLSADQIRAAKQAALSLERTAARRAEV